MSKQTSWKEKSLFLRESFEGKGVCILLKLLQQFSFRSREKNTWNAWKIYKLLQRQITLLSRKLLVQMILWFSIKSNKTEMMLGVSRTHTATFTALTAPPLWARLIKVSVSLTVMGTDIEDEWLYYHCHVYWLLDILSQNIREQHADINKLSLKWT